MKILKLTDETRKNLLEELLKRSPNSYKQYEDSVNTIIEKVRSERDRAVFSYTKQFDGADINEESIKVTREEIEEAYHLVDLKLIEVMKKSLDNIRIYHEKQRQYSWFDSRPDGVMLGQKVTPIARVGVYVPGNDSV